MSYRYCVNGKVFGEKGLQEKVVGFARVFGVEDLELSLRVLFVWYMVYRWIFEWVYSVLRNFVLGEQ